MTSVPDARDLRAVADRLAIVDVIYRYARGIDQRDVDSVLACFTDDARIDFLGLAEVEGTEALRVLFEGRSGAKPVGLDTMGPTTHVMANPLVEVDGDAAHMDTTAVAYLPGTRDGEQLVVVRGLRYQDDLLRTPAGWRIRNRVHTARWMYEVPALPV